MNWHILPGKANDTMINANQFGYQADSGTPPNIILMISHDLGCQIGPYGHFSDDTPALNKLASQGVCLDRHFVSSPGCSQSRSSLMTGRYPHANGQFGLANWGWKLNEDEELLPGILRNQAGYHTALFGIWHLHEWTLSAFDTLSDDVSTLDSSPEGYAEIASHRAARWLQQHRGQDKPFYLHVGFWEVHRPFCGARSPVPMMPHDQLQEVSLPDYLPQDDVTRCEFVELQSSVKRVDQGVSRILNALQESGFAENTIVIFTADHGLPFQRAKGTLYDPGIHVSGIMRWPHYIPEGTRLSNLSSNIDVMPTVLEAVRVSPGSRLHGRSILDEVTQSRSVGIGSEYIFAEKTYHEHYDPIRCVRSSRFKYIKNYASRPMLVLPSDIYNSPTRQAFHDDEAIWGHRPSEEFYDLERDPWERQNRISDEEYKADVDHLRNELDRWMNETDDPLRYGKIGRPGESQDSSVSENINFE